MSGLDTSNDLSETNYWANVRLSADGSGARPDIMGAEKITMDVIVDKPTAVQLLLFLKALHIAGQILRRLSR